MRKEFQITDDELKDLYSACKPTRVMYLSDGRPIGGTPQENANDYWKKLAQKYGFIWDSVKPTEKGDKVFTAESS